MLEVLNGDHGDFNDILKRKSNNGLNQKWRSQIQISYPKGARIWFCECLIKFYFYFLEKSVTRDNINNVKFKTGLCTGRYSTSYPYQISVLIRRTFLIIMRDKTLTLNRLLTHFCIALFIGEWLQLKLQIIYLQHYSKFKKNTRVYNCGVKYCWKTTKHVS